VGRVWRVSDCEELVGVAHRRRKKKEGENYEYMSHLVSDKWFRRTLLIPRFGGVLQELGILWNLILFVF